MNEDKPVWAQQRQSDPPDFGQARMVSRWRLDWTVRRRRPKAERILSRAREITDFEPGTVSLVVLSCKRLAEIKRLVDSMAETVGSAPDDPPVERILVDNGSGPDLVDYARRCGFFDRIIAHDRNLGMAVALDDAFPRCRGEYILLLEEDFVLDDRRPFLRKCLRLFDEYPEIGIIRLKNQNNWGKSFRVIAPLRETTDGTAFWTWLPSRNGRLNVWAAGSVLFRKVSFVATGRLPSTPNFQRTHPRHQGAMYELEYGKRYNRVWLAAKIQGVYPFFQPNDNPVSPGWGEVTAAA